MTKPAHSGAFKAIITNFQITCADWHLDDALHDGGTPDPDNFHNAKGLAFEFFYVRSGEHVPKSISYQSSAGVSGVFPLPAGAVTIIARLVEKEGNGVASIDHLIPVLVQPITEDELDAMFATPSVLVGGLHPDAAVLKLMALGDSTQSAGVTRQRRDESALELASQLGRRHILLNATLQQLHGAILSQTLTPNLAGRILTAIAAYLGAGNPEPVTPQSALLAVQGETPVPDSQPVRRIARSATLAHRRL